MNNDLFLTLLSGAPSIPGLWLLQRAFRLRSGERPDAGSWKGTARILAGLILIAIPLAIWGEALLHPHRMAAQHVSPGSVFLLAGYVDVLFFWLVWNVNVLVFPGVRSGENPWDKHWGASYSPELKKRLLGSVLEQWDREEKIGNLVVDIGSGANPISNLLPATPERRYILVDIAGRNGRTLETQSIRGDASRITQPDSLGYRKAIVRVCRFLGKEPRSPVRDTLATTMVFSDILNYVDFRQVIAGFTELLEPNGRILIVNLPGRGIREQFSGRGLRDNCDLYPFLEERNLEIEYKSFPCRPERGTAESEELIVLIARKAGAEFP